MSGAWAETLRIATYHTELDRDGPGLLLRDLLSEKDAQVEAVIAVLRASKADVLVLAGIDYDMDGIALGVLADRLELYPYHFAAAPNRGLPSGFDLNGDGRIGGPEDAVGFAQFRGQKGLAVLSKLPIATSKVRDFSKLPWRDLPGNLAPPGVPDDLPLSTTGHWDVPIELPWGGHLHVMIWHATPPIFDGPEDRNGRRNHDETAIWHRYIDGALAFDPPEHFVLAGMANLDPVDGNGRDEALTALLSDPRVADPKPASRGAVEAARADGGVNKRHRGDPALDTADWEDTPNRPGNLRVDYVLPSSNLTVLDAGVFWPPSDGLLRSEVELASRHRLVWVDVQMPDRLGEGG